MQRVDAAIVIFLVGLAAYVSWATFDYPSSLVANSPGPAFFPRLLSAALGVLAILLAVDARKRISDERPRLRMAELCRVAAMLVLLVAFIMGILEGDTFILLPLLLASTMLLMGERRLGVIVVVPLAFDFFVYVMFFRLLGVKLPTRYF